MHLAKKAARSLFHSMGGVNAVRFRNRGALRILMYHRFANPESDLVNRIERQAEHLSSHYRVLSLTEAAHRLHAGDALPQNALAITVDDGHRDFYSVAYPIFQRYNLPATLYLTTQYVDGLCWLWFDQVDYLFEHTTVASAELDGVGVSPWPLVERTQRDKAAEAVKQAMLTMPNARRMRLLADLPSILKMDVPTNPPERWAPLAWEEAREMAKHGIEFGAHTQTHPVLSRLESEEEVDREIRGSKLRIEEELQIEAAHFCYPNGCAEDLNEVAIEQVRRAGFRTAVTAQPGMNWTGAPPFLLKRIPADPTHKQDSFERAVAGFRLS